MAMLNNQMVYKQQIRGRSYVLRSGSVLKSPSHRSKCGVNDYFILYYEGHGTVLRDPDFQVAPDMGGGLGW